MKEDLRTAMNSPFPFDHDRILATSYREEEQMDDRVTINSNSSCTASRRRIAMKNKTCPGKLDGTYLGLSFPLKMYSMMEDAERDGFEDIVSWQASGTSFKIHRPNEFVDVVLKKYFSQSRLKSFQRQLNIYGFKKVAMGPYKGGYQHKFFNRGKPELCSRIVRRRTLRDFENTASKPCIDSDIMPIPLDFVATTTSSSEAYHYIQRILSDEEYTDTDSSVSHLLSDLDWGTDDDIFPLDPHGCELFSPLIPTESESPTTKLMDSDMVEVDNEEPTDLSFPYKVHMMIENAEKENYSHIVSWTKDGKAFQVHNVDEFVKSVLPLYFDQSKYESFRRQLNLYQFKRVARGELRGTISHPSFVRGERWMCEEIKRTRCQSHTS